MNPINFTTMWSQLILDIEENPDIHTSLLARKKAYSHNYLYATLLLLEKNNIVIKVQHPNNKRIKMIRLTEKGKYLYVRIKAIKELLR